MNQSNIQHPTSNIACPVRHFARATPQAPALVTPDNVLSYADLDRRVTSTAHRIEQKDLERRVALYLPPSASYLILLWALLRTRRVACPLSTRTPPEGLGSFLNDLGSRLLLTREDLALEDVHAHAPDALLGDAKPPPDVPVYFETDQPATAVFTSGSTGRAKAALHSVGNHHFSALGSRENIALRPGDRWLLSLPLYHVGGLAILFRCWQAGAAVVVPGKDAALAEALMRYEITHVSMVTTQLRRLLEAPPDVRSVTAMLLGGGPIPDSLLQAAHEHGWPIHTSYGLTEMASQVTTTPPAASFEMLRTAGRLLPHRQLHIADDGEILVLGDTLFLGYLDGKEMHRPTDDDGWFATGDVGRLDAEDRLHVTGRTDNMFISGGENIQPETIEEALHQLGDVQRAVVVPVPDSTFGQRPVAFVQSAPGKSPEDWARQLEGALSRFMIPDAVYPWPDDLEEGMKPDRAALRRRAQALQR